MAKKKSETNTERVQAVLNWKYFREKDALDVRKALIDKSVDLPGVKDKDWTDREIITEGLIALGEKLQNGWTAPDVPTEITISADVISMLGKIHKAIDMLAKMDITQLRQVDGFDEDAFETMKAEGLKAGAAKIFSDDTKFEGDDW